MALHSRRASRRKEGKTGATTENGLGMDRHPDDRLFHPLPALPPELRSQRAPTEFLRLRRRIQQYDWAGGCPSFQHLIHRHRVCILHDAVDLSAVWAGLHPSIFLLSSKLLEGTCCSGRLHAGPDGVVAGTGHQLRARFLGTQTSARRCDRPKTHLPGISNLRNNRCHHHLLCPVTG